MPASSITSVKALNLRQLGLVIPGAPSYLLIACSQVPKSGSGVATFWPSQSASGAAENLVLPLYRIVVQHMKNQILTEVTAALETQHGARHEESERSGTRK